MPITDKDPQAESNRTAAPTIALYMTRRCNMSCAHCSVESAPRVDTPDPSEESLREALRAAAANGVRAVQFTGGEPMMRQKLVLQLMKEAQQMGLGNGLTTNGFWGKNPKTAYNILAEMIRYGLAYMTVSYDRYHAEFMGPEPVLNIARAAEKLGFFFNVNVTRTLTDEKLDEYADLFGNLPAVRMRLYDVQPLGRARNFDLPTLRAEVEGFCNAAAQATFTEDGRVIACNGPAYFDKPDSPRHIGHRAETSSTELLQQHWSNPIMETIRTFGPAGLRDELMKMPQFADAFDRRFAGQCDLCHTITSNPEMVAALQEPLNAPAHRAKRVAKWRIIAETRRAGEYTRDFANGTGMNQIFYDRITTGQWPENTHRILGRADLDWHNCATYLAGSGVAGQLAAASHQAELQRWAPPYFATTLQKRATQDALRELSHRETLELMHKELERLGLQAILLKGAALYLREKSRGATPLRVPGDIDILLPDEASARAFRLALIQFGFKGEPDAPRTGPHHLAPVTWRGSMVEIHTGIMPSFWGLPESIMFKEALGLGGWSQYQTLSPEHMALHELVHATSHLYSFGFKLALDLHRINNYAAELGQTVDWQRVCDLADRTYCPNAFYVPLATVLRGMPGRAGIPVDITSRLPKSKHFRRMQLIAHKRLFTATDNAEQMNPFTRNGIFILLHNNLLTRARYLAMLSTGTAAESRRTHLGSDGGQSWKNLRTHLKAAWLDLKAYRRATR